MSKKPENEPCGLTNMNCVDESKKKSAYSIDNMNAIAEDNKKPCSITNMNCPNKEKKANCDITDMNCMGDEKK